MEHSCTYWCAESGSGCPVLDSHPKMRKRIKSNWNGAYQLLTDLLEYHQEHSDINNSGGPNKNMEFARRIEEFLG